jgi:hypothetical protein
MPWAHGSAIPIRPIRSIRVSIQGDTP